MIRRILSALIIMVMLILPSVDSLACRDLAARFEGNQALVAGDHFSTGRGLSLYLEYFGDHFYRSLTRLYETNHVVDLGSGQGRFIAEVAQLDLRALTSNRVKSTDKRESVPRWRDDLLNRSSEEVPRYTGVAYLMDESRKRQLHDLAVQKYGDQRVNFKTGRYFGEWTSADLTRTGGRVDLWVDFWGVLSYTSTPSQDVRLIAQSSAPGAQVFIRVGPSNFHDQPDKSSMFRSVVRTRRGEISFPEWLVEHISGVSARFTEDNQVLVLTINDPDRVRVPELEHIGDQQEEVTPPLGRIFVER